MTQMAQLLRLASLAVLWIALAGLTGLTVIDIIASRYPSNCGVVFARSTPLFRCPPQSQIAYFVRVNSNILQALHGFLVLAIDSFTLIVFIPRLQSIAWSLFRNGATISGIHASIEFVYSPGIVTALNHAISLRSMTFTVAFVLLVGIHQQLVSFAIAPIYQRTPGSYSVDTLYDVGGGVGPATLSTFTVLDAQIISSGITRGRTLLNAAILANSSWVSNTGSNSVFPWLTDLDVARTSSADLKGVATYTNLDCGASAVQRAQNGSQPVFQVDRRFWDPRPVVLADIELSGVSVGSIISDNTLSMAYYNTVARHGPGWIEMESSVFFMLSNDTLEGAQIHVESPRADSRISNLDVLVCTSTARLAHSDCSIRPNQTEPSNSVVSCVPNPSNVDPKFAGNEYGGIDQYINNPESAVALLSTAPVWMTWWISTRLPAYADIGNSIAGGLVPIPYTTANTFGYHNVTVPLSYITDIIFPTNQHYLTQGLLSTYTVSESYTANLRVSLGSRYPGLQAGILVVSVIIAALGTLGAISRRKDRRAPEIDTARLLAISRHPDVGRLLGNYADTAREIPESVQDTRLVYNAAAPFGLMLERSVNQRVDSAKFVGDLEEEIGLMEVTGPLRARSSGDYFRGEYSR